MRRAIMTAATCLLALTACAGAADEPAASSSSSAAHSSSAAATTTAAALGQVDVSACQSFVTRQGDVHDFLARLEEEGSVPAREALGAQLDLLSIAGTAGIYADQVESQDLRDAMQVIVQEGGTIRTALNAQQPIAPTSLRVALENAAEVCQEGGFVIDWYDG